MEVLLAILILILDQGTKLWAHSVLRAKPLVLIPGALELTYLENRGAVWGLMQGWRIVFLIATFLFLGIMLWFYIRKRRDMSLLTRIILALLFSGAVGNLIDRVPRLRAGYDLFQPHQLPRIQCGGQRHYHRGLSLDPGNLFREVRKDHLRSFGDLLLQEAGARCRA